MGGRGSSSSKTNFNVSAYNKTKQMLTKTIAEIDARIRLFDSNPTPNGLRMAQQLENQKKDWQKQLDNLEAEYLKYNKGNK